MCVVNARSANAGRNVVNAGRNVCGKCWKKCVQQMLEEMCAANARKNVWGKCSK